MIKSSVALVIAILCAGCAHVSVTKSVTTTGTNTTFSGYSFFANSTLKSIGVDSTTKTTTNLLKASGVTSEPNAEAITAAGASAGSIIGAGVEAGLRAAGMMK